ncbi:MAG: gluconolactonase [Isosphaeraceae bacterium]|nr:MAG: gluconolactonase [Isosphaeraceae bacterium]
MLASLAWFAALVAAQTQDPVVPPRPQNTYPPLGTIERLDPRFDTLVPRDAQVERLAEGFEWAEGPVWMPDLDGGVLLFSDVPANTVYLWKPGTYGAAAHLRPSGYTGRRRRGGEPGSNGLLRDPSGRLILMQHGDRRVARLADDGTFVTLADRYQGKRFNSPNDGVFDSSGNLYFTDPPYGLEQGVDDPARELDFQGVYRLTPDGNLSLLTKEMSRPNGIALSPDEKTLYVANSDPERAIWMAFPLNPDGTLGPGRVFADVTHLVGKADKPGLPDGLKVDIHGNLFATGPGGVLVFAPDGTHLGTFATGQATANCGWGEDGATLFITADMYLGRVKLTTKGKGF